MCEDSWRSFSFEVWLDRRFNLASNSVMPATPSKVSVATQRSSMAVDRRGRVENHVGDREKGMRIDDRAGVASELADRHGEARGQMLPMTLGIV